MKTRPPRPSRQAIVKAMLEQFTIDPRMPNILLRQKNMRPVSAKPQNERKPIDVARGHVPDMRRTVHIRPYDGLHSVVRYTHGLWIQYYGVDIPEGTFIDHINGDSLDDRIDNLQLIDRRLNKRKQTTQANKAGSKYPGVTCDTSAEQNPFTARIGINGEEIYLGSYADEIIPAYVSLQARILAFGPGCTQMTQELRATLSSEMRGVDFETLDTVVSAALSRPRFIAAMAADTLPKIDADGRILLDTCRDPALKALLTPPKRIR